MAWIDACAADEVEAEDAVRFDHAGQTYAIYLTDAGDLFCTSGLCPRDGAHLAGGIVEGSLVECPMDGCIFDIRDGASRSGEGAPQLGTYPVRLAAGRVQVDLPQGATPTWS